jgi:RNA polymerase sigma-70 factor (ECF subfamily)
MTLGSAFQETLGAARVGAEWAWTEIYRDLAPAVLGYLRSRGADDPEDLLAEVFLQAVKGLPRFSGDERDFRTWVLAIAHRRMVDSYRRKTRLLESSGSLGEVLARAEAGDVEHDGLTRIEAERAIGLIRQLVPAQQEVILLRLIADLTIEEIARVLGKRQGAVKALQRRGLAALRKKLSETGVPL